MVDLFNRGIEPRKGAEKFHVYFKRWNQTHSTITVEDIDEALVIIFLNIKDSKLKEIGLSFSKGSTQFERLFTIEYEKNEAN